MSGADSRNRQPAARASGAAEWKLLAFALLGPVFLYGFVALLLGGGGWLLWHALTTHQGVVAGFKIGLPMVIIGLALLWGVLKSRPGEEAHIELSRRDAPRLWEMVDDTARRLNAPDITSLRITAEYNASALLQNGLFRREARITIGLPLMLALDAGELRAVLAHEIGHISRNHSRASIYVWRAMAHGEAMYAAAGDGWVAGMIARFYAWYAPRLLKKGADFSRRQEFDADAAAALIAGNETAARALMALSARQVFFASAMEQVRQAVTSGAPELPDIFALMRAAMRDEKLAEEVDNWLQRALHAREDVTDSHPGLFARVTALGVNPLTRVPPPLPQAHALDAVFGPGAAAVEARMLRAWRAGNARDMKTAKMKVALTEQNIRRIRAEIAAKGPSVMRNISLARYLMAAHRPREALQALAEITGEKDIRDLPAFAQALRGVALIYGNDPAGVHDLLEAAGRNPEIMQLAAIEISDWLDGPGARHDTPALRRELARLMALYEEGARERGNVSGKTRLAPIGLTREEMEGLRAALKPHAGAFRAVWIAGRACETLPKWRHLEILIEFRPGFWLKAFDGRSKIAGVMDEIREALPDFHDCSFSLRPWPFFTPKGFVKRMRKLGAPLPLDEQPATEARRPAARVALAAPPAVVKPRRAPILGRALKPLGGGLILASLALPAFIGWKVFVNNSATHARITQMERQYEQDIASRPWRKEAMVSPRDPAKTVAAYFAARRAHEASPFLPIYTRGTREMLRKRHVPAAAMDAEVNAYAACGAPDMRIGGDYAVARFRPGQRRCPPLFLQKEDGRWRMDLAAMSRVIGFGQKGYWHFYKPVPAEYGFAFSDWAFDGNGYPLKG